MAVSMPRAAATGALVPRISWPFANASARAPPGIRPGNPRDRFVMNVLFVHYGDDWIAGSEVALLELMRELARKGVTPFLWCNAPAMQRAAEESGIAVRRDDFTYYFDYSPRAFSPAAYRRLVRKASALIAETGAQIVQCNSAAPAQWMSLACRRANVP